jgi:hypothetical protein
LNRRPSGFVLMGVDKILFPRTSDPRDATAPQPASADDERPSMSRVHYGSRAVTRLSRRRVITIAATVGVGVSAASVAGLSLAGEKPAAGDSAPLVLSLRDAKKGTFDVFSGGSRVTLTDAKLAAQLLKAVKRA